MSESIKQNNQIPECIIVDIQKFDQFPIWIIRTAREEVRITAFNYEVGFHFNQRY